jgi:hypothetical protein
MLRSILVVGLLLLASPLACGGGGSPQASQPDGGSPTGTPTPAPGPTSTVGPAPSACPVPAPTQQASFGSQADVQSQLDGVWRTCQGAPLPPGTVGGPAGWEVLPNGYHFALGFDSAGGVLRLTGFLNEGQLTYVGGTSGPSLVPAGIPMQVFLSLDKTTLFIDDEAGPSGPFVASQDPVGVRTPEPAGAREGAAGCQVLETGILPIPANDNEAASRVVGTWMVCPNAVPSNPRTLGPPGTVGVHFDPSGTWAWLVASGGGAPVASTDPAAHGTWASQSSGPSAGPSATWGLTMTSGAGTLAFVTTASSSPVKLMIYDEGGIAVLSAN